MAYCYVYRDPTRVVNGVCEPFYVGKGSGRRAYYHLRRKDTHPVTNRVKSLKAQGITPHIEIIEALDTQHAFFLEECLVALLGRKRNSSPGAKERNSAATFKAWETRRKNKELQS